MKKKYLKKTLFVNISINFLYYEKKYKFGRYYYYLLDFSIIINEKNM